MGDALKTEAHVPVDLFNPGQVFACLGLLEAADVLCGDAEAYFDWSDASDVRFRLRANGPESPVERVLRFLDEAGASAEVVEGSPNIEAWDPVWGDAPRVVLRSSGYPFPDPSSPATLVCALIAGSERLTLDHWGDESGRDNVKFWAGAQGLPGAVLARRMLEAVRRSCSSASGDPFAVARPQSNSFRLDWRRDYIPIDLGFSLNEHKSTMIPMGFPLVELLAAIGLSHARPRRVNARDKLRYEYAVAGRRSADESAPWLPLPLVRAALGPPAAQTRSVTLPWPMRRFRMCLDWTAKEGQMRSITTVAEERTS